MTQQLALAENVINVPSLEKREMLTRNEVLRMAGAVQDILDHVLKKGTHYDVIPGTDRPALLKAGAEKVAATFRLAPKCKIESEGGRHAGYFRHIVTCSLYSIGSEVFVGEGVGICSTDEEKYRWQVAINHEHFESFDPSQRRIKFKKDRDSGEVIKIEQVASDFADKDNTVLKMSAKRALVAAILNATACSDMFTQDEDFLEEVAEAMGEQAESKPREEKKARPIPTINLPKYGRNHCKGKPVNDPSVTIEDLQYYFKNISDNIDKPERASYKKSNQATLDGIKAEIERRQAEAKSNEPTQEQAQEGSGAGASESEQPDPKFPDETWEALAKDIVNYKAECAALVKKYAVKSVLDVPSSKRGSFFSEFKELIKHKS